MNRRDELLALEDKGWHELCSSFDRLAGDDWTRAGVNGEWSPKDLLAHIAVWHALCTDRLETLRVTGTVPPLPAEVDTINDEQYERSRDLTVKEVRAMSGASRHRFREELSQLSGDPGDHVAQMIVGDGSGHYEVHMPQLRAFLGES